jgi:hypothetical protein
LSALDFGSENAQQCTNIVSGLGEVKILRNTISSPVQRFFCVPRSNDDFDFLADLDTSALNSARRNRARPVMVKTSSTGIKNGMSALRSGVGM